MTEDEALARMVSPGMRRSMVWRGGILQVWITRACDKACYSCSQGSNLAGKPGMITLEQYDLALRSLKGYFGVVGMHGGNPAVHPEFPELCEILRSHFPKEQCGLFCNNPLGHGKTMRQTFNPAFSNLNVHMDRRAAEEFARDWPESCPAIIGLDTDSRHVPPYVAMQDVIPDEAERWSLISACDINQIWSAYITVLRGRLRGFFCEVAAGQAQIHESEEDYPDTGLEVVPGWWQRPMQDFVQQVRYHCHACGIPLRSYGQLSQSLTEAEQVSQTHAAVYKLKKPGRRLQVVTDRGQVLEQALSTAVEYIANASK